MPCRGSAWMLVSIAAAVAAGCASGARPTESPPARVAVPAPQPSPPPAAVEPEPTEPEPTEAKPPAATRRCAVAVQVVDGGQVVGAGEATGVGGSKRAACQEATREACHRAAKAPHCPWGQFRIQRVEGLAFEFPAERRGPWATGVHGPRRVDSLDPAATESPEPDRPDAERLRACHVAAYVLGEATYQGEASRTDDTPLKPVAMDALCRNYEQATGRTCAEDELRVTASSTQMKLQTTGGTMTREHKLTLTARRVLGRAAATSPPAPTKAETCEQATVAACRQALGGATCPRDRVRVVATDGIPNGAGVGYFLSDADFEAWRAAVARAGASR